MVRSLKFGHGNVRWCKDDLSDRQWSPGEPGNTGIHESRGLEVGSIQDLNDHDGYIPLSGLGEKLPSP